MSVVLPLLDNPKMRRPSKKQKKKTAHQKKERRCVLHPQYVVGMVANTHLSIFLYFLLYRLK